MKRVAITVLAIVLIPIVAFSKDTDSRALLCKVDVSHPHYGNKIYGVDKVNTFHSRDKSILLIYQARYGGDGDHTEKLLKLFKFKNNKGKKILDQNIDSVEFVQENGNLKYIKGKYIGTLCNICDGWEESEPADIFSIPIVIDVESLTVKSELSEKAKADLLVGLDQQANKNIAEQLSFGNKKYPTFVSTVKKQIKDLLQNK